MNCNWKKVVCCLVTTAISITWVALWIFFVHSLRKKDNEGSVTFSLLIFYLSPMPFSRSFLEQPFEKVSMDNYSKWFGKLIYGSILIINLVTCIVIFDTRTVFEKYWMITLIIVHAGVIAYKILCEYCQYRKQTAIIVFRHCDGASGFLTIQQDNDLKFRET